jgi:hypothetical protein
MKEAIETLLLQERVELAPRIRELDQQIEDVERNLRSLIARKLEHRLDLVPSDIRLKARERFESDLRKRPFLDASFQSTLDGQLEYFDLRELQQTIVNKDNWPRFETALATKDALAVRCSQIADLRNAIRHTRSIDDVLVHDGQAAIEWFGRVFGQHLPPVSESPEFAEPLAARAAAPPGS